ncbi:hypothetical protein LJC18_03810 [Lachnospiraceae bacterium OttesenSCG-928-E19]|nr:hypothetical protein [Lachnospiraceae bacterium OttesenSCG-928-E19]
MKPIMLFSIILMAAIILAASFGLHVMPIEPLYTLSPEQAANALYVCPAESQIWDSVSMAIRPYVRYINMFFFFLIMILLFFWGWSLYQNLLKDKFEQNAFKGPWAFTKFIFWAAVTVILLVMTPNYFRTVTVAGTDTPWVLCEANSPNALPVIESAVKR